MFVNNDGLNSCANDSKFRFEFMKNIKVCPYESYHVYYLLSSFPFLFFTILASCIDAIHGWLGLCYSKKPNELLTLICHPINNHGFCSSNESAGSSLVKQIPEIDLFIGVLKSFSKLLHVSMNSYGFV